VGLNIDIIEIFMEWVAKIYTQICLTGPVIISVLITNAKGMQPYLTEEAINVPTACLTWHGQEFSFRELVAAVDICKDPKTILERLHARFLQAFGIW